MQYEVKNVYFSYNGLDVLKSISFSMKKGEFLSIVGPNGAGKSTLLKVMAGLLKPLSGEVFFDDIPVDEHDRRSLAQRVGYLPHENMPAFPFTCFDLVMMGRTPHLKGLMLGGKTDRDIVERVMRSTDCYQFAERDIKSISAGEQQRVFIARALAAEPEILLMDEAITSLDLEHAVQIFRLLDTLNSDQGISVVSISHNLNITSQFSKRIILLLDGEILGDGTPGAVLNMQLLSRIYGNSFDLIHKRANGPVIVPKKVLNNKK